ncbi:MAG: hypothetical protein A2289_26100 [Deltaproteobacteria bacterium RIFOXYA12_FULL_58_15]|nr:MAG: hypothetical protein A2289_26100 [Deltaproteobacteria bacterium RIFOXYA12_FULL_58_15]OGR11317.1 MAG: hypothetical protein A2341_07085 [Deltaproteobacteria bacterium RIFOXYB12_FULL_58_9]
MSPLSFAALIVFAQTPAADPSGSVRDDVVVGETAEPTVKTEPPGICPVVIVGALETVGVSPDIAHYGVYVSVGFGLNIPLNQDWMLIPSVAIEFSPEFGAWGGTAFLAVDRFMTQVGDVVLTFEPQVGLVHDAVPDGQGGFVHALYLAAGAGFAVVTHHGALIPQLVVTYGFDSSAISLVPTLLFSVPF